ncbi:hypothetical protein [Bacillus wiedmannii]|uniref:hypothetical protein n=1 Tax=Bacillus wiedmannii TaxID=1890302 RepID=UPI002E22BA1F|nr:hypothetical protein [Bacillus wiedmannii]
MKFRLVNFTLPNNNSDERFQESLKVIEQMLEQNVDCTIVEEGDEDACIMKSVVKTMYETSYYTF